jgi:hypothetical protein
MFLWNTFLYVRFMILAPYLVGAFTTFLAFLLNQWWVQHRDRKLRFDKILSLLQAGRTELQFQTGKLDRLKQDLEQAIAAAKTNTPFSFPSYSLSPAFVDKLKSELLDYPHTTSLISVMGNLHFELVHIQQRMDGLYETVKDGLVDTNFFRRLQGTQGLIDMNLEALKSGEKTIADKLAAVENDYNFFMENSPFQWLLSEAPMY